MGKWRMERNQRRVILSAAKDLCLAQREILRCAQDDREGAHTP